MRGDLDKLEQWQTLCDADHDKLAAEMAGVKKVLQVIAGILGTGVAGYFFSLLSQIGGGG